MLKHVPLKTARRFSFRLAVIIALFPVLTMLSSCNKEVASNPTTSNPVDNDPKPVDPSIAIPTSPGAMGAIPEDNLLSNPQFAARVELGRHLYFDGRISVGGDSLSTDPDKQAGVSCASCHSPSQGFSDPLATAQQPMSFGVKHFKGFRNSPGLTNVAYNAKYTWDGKFTTLEDHAPGPMFSAAEMGTVPSSPSYYGKPNEDTLLLFQRLQKESKYVQLFTDAFGNQSMGLDRICKAIASFERTFISTQSPFDEYNKALHNAGGNASAISESAKRGFTIFIDPVKGNCVSCHSGFNFTDGGFHNNGLKPDQNDLGQKFVTGSNEDLNKFKVPTLRNIAVTGPYMHNGQFATLEDVVRHYQSLPNNNHFSSNVDQRVRTIRLTEQDVTDVVEFLKTLTDEGFINNMAFANPWK